MQHTKKYKFNLIETSDPFSPEKLNANAEAVEAELARLDDEAVAFAAAIGSGGKNARIAYGTYVGDGQFGPTHANKLTFGFKPDLLIIARSYSTYQILLRESEFPISDLGYYSHVIWEDNSVSWHDGKNSQNQYNLSDVTYYWVAIGEPLE